MKHEEIESEVDNHVASAIATVRSVDVFASVDRWNLDSVSIAISVCPSSPLLKLSRPASNQTPDHTAALAAPDRSSGAPPPSAAPSMSPRNIAIIGGGIVGVSTAYYLSRSPALDSETTVTLVEGVGIAAGASGYAGGFLAREREWHTDDTAGECLCGRLG